MAMLSHTFLKLNLFADVKLFTNFLITYIYINVNETYTYTQQVSSATYDHGNNFVWTINYIGQQVKPGVCSVGVQYSESQI